MVDDTHGILVPEANFTWQLTLTGIRNKRIVKCYEITERSLCMA